MATFGKWQDIETAPRDGTRILTKNVTPTWDEDEKKTVIVKAISVAYWLFGDWMEYPANPRYVQGKKHTHWMPIPDEDDEEEKANYGVIAAAESLIKADRDQVLTTAHVNALENAIKIQRGISDLGKAVEKARGSMTPTPKRGFA
jgi:hypothetical protein